MIPLKDDIPSDSFPYVNYTLIALNVFFFFVELAQGPGLLKFIYQYGFVPLRFTVYLSDPNIPFLTAVAPIFTSMFLHGGWLHLIGNMLYLYIFGDNVEDVLGHFRYAIFYLLCGFTAALVQYTLHPHSTVPMIGASGAIAGVLGAYFVLFPFARIYTLVVIFFFIEVIAVPAFFYLFFWFLLQLLNGSAVLAFSGVQGQGIAWWAHIGGFVAGVALVFMFKRKRRLTYRVYRPW
jgi:membrane associated rhomboid family serine protease